MTRHSASVARLEEIKDVTKEDALEIKRIWSCGGSRAAARDRIDRILRTYGVEYLGIHKRRCLDVHYCNAGDPYATTIIFIGDTLRVGCWGDLMERKQIREREQL